MKRSGEARVVQAIKAPALIFLQRVRAFGIFFHQLVHDLREIQSAVRYFLRNRGLRARSCGPHEDQQEQRAPAAIWNSVRRMDIDIVCFSGGFAQPEFRIQFRCLRFFLHRQEGCFRLRGRGARSVRRFGTFPQKSGPRNQWKERAGGLRARIESLYLGLGHQDRQQRSEFIETYSQHIPTCRVPPCDAGPPRGVTTAGTPEASASRTARPNVSVSEGNTNASMSAYARERSLPVSQPLNSACRIFSRSHFSSAPWPIRTIRKSRLPFASRSFSSCARKRTFFSGVSRPT